MTPAGLTWRHAPAVLWAAGIWLSSSVDWGPQDVGGWLPEWLPADKLVHFLVYAVLGALWAWPARMPGVRTLVVAWALAAGWGALDEVHQAYVPGRQPDVLDWLADATGAALAVGAWGWNRRVRPARLG